MILIKKRVQSVPVNVDTLKKDVQKLLDAVGYSDFDLGILLTTNKTIRKYNKQYRNKDKATDILSFSYYPKLKPGQPIKPRFDEDKNLGDIIISLERVAHDAKELGVGFKGQLNRVLVHGICHLLGYTHDTDKMYQQMQKKEQALLDVLKKR